MFKALAVGTLTATFALSTAFALDYVAISQTPASTIAIAQRVDDAFATASEDVTQVIVYRESRPASCAKAVWPHIDSACLVNETGNSASSVRVIY